MTVLWNWGRSERGVTTVFLLAILYMLALLLSSSSVQQVHMPLPLTSSSPEYTLIAARETVSSIEAGAAATTMITYSQESSVPTQITDIRKEKVNDTESNVRVDINKGGESKPGVKDDAEKNSLIEVNGEPEAPSRREERCWCDQITIRFPSMTLNYLNLTLSWLNMSTAEYLRRRHPNFPVELVRQMMIEGTRCSLLPELSNITWINTYWQELQMKKDVRLYLYSATYDNRPLIDVRPCVRVLLTTKTSRPPKPWCHLWFNVTGPPDFTRAVRIEFVGKEKISSDVQQSFLVTCAVPAGLNKPQAVSLLPSPCTRASNLLTVVGSGTREPSAYLDGGVLPQHSRGSMPRYSVAVCGPALFFYHQDFSWRLVEWLEILRAQGIAKVFLFETDVHPNLQKVLRYYEKEGFLEVTQYSYPPPYNNDPSTRRLWTLVNRVEMFKQERMYFNDCLLRHMHQYRFIAHYDPDEVPLLLHHHTYNDFLSELLKRSHSELGSRNVSLPVAYKLHWSIFYDDIPPPARTSNLPKFLHVMQHILRPKENEPQTRGRFKALYDMDTVTGVYSHGAIICGSGLCPSDGMKVNPNLAYLGHFTRTCGQKCQAEGYLKEETALLKYVDTVKEAVTRVLTELNLL